MTMMPMRMRERERETTKDKSRTRRRRRWKRETHASECESWFDYWLQVECVCVYDCFMLWCALYHIALHCTVLYCIVLYPCYTVWAWKKWKGTGVHVIAIEMVSLPMQFNVKKCKVSSWGCPQFSDMDDHICLLK